MGSFRNILLEPGGQGDVPPSPEFTDRVGDIWVIEVFLELKSEHPAQANRHIRIA